MTSKNPFRVERSVRQMMNASTTTPQIAIDNIATQDEAMEFAFILASDDAERLVVDAPKKFTGSMKFGKGWKVTTSNGSDIYYTIKN